MRVVDFLARVRLDINDIDGDRFPNAYIVDILNEAYGEMLNVRPDLFQQQVVVRLNDGEWQEPCCVERIKSVDALTDANGVWVADIRKVEVGASSALGRRRCVPSAPVEYAMESDGARRFLVYPPVKPNQSVFVRLTAAVRPETVAFDDETAQIYPMGAAYYGALVDFVLYRLYSTETESVSSAQKAAWHRSAFYEKLGLQQRAKQAYQSEKVVSK